MGGYPAIGPVDQPASSGNVGEDPERPAPPYFPPEEYKGIGGPKDLSTRGQDPHLPKELLLGKIQPLPDPLLLQSSKAKPPVFQRSTPALDHPQAEPAGSVIKQPVVFIFRHFREPLALKRAAAR